MAEAKNTEKKATKKAKDTPKTGAFAVIETGGKQYKVSVGDTIKIEKIKGAQEVGSKIMFDRVLLVDNGADVTQVGAPFLDGAKVLGTISKIGRAPKVTVIKYKQKSRYFKKNGHRQPYFEVKIDAIS